MHALKLQRFPAGTILLLMSALVVIGFIICSRYDDINRTPLFWLVAFAVAPLISIGCVVALWWQKSRPRWLAAVAAILALPQLGVLCVTIWWMLHCLGLVK
jgi:hypothetical protein